MPEFLRLYNVVQINVTISLFDRQSYIPSAKDKYYLLELTSHNYKISILINFKA